MNIEEKSSFGQLQREKVTNYKNFEILTPENFFIDFAEYAEKSQKRVYAQTMYAEGGRAFNTVAESLIKANTRGIDTKLHIDYYSLLVDGQQVYWIPTVNTQQRRKRRQARKLKKQAIQDIQEAGVDVTITNPPKCIEKILPFKGRNHIKLAIIDNVAWVGGISYRDDDLVKEDFMMRITDPSIVSRLEEQFHRVNDCRITSDMEYRCNDETTLIVDSGRPGKSKIFDHALQLVRKANASVKLATQYSPNGVMVRTLFDVYRQKKTVEVITSSHNSIVEWFGKVLDSANKWFNVLRRNHTPILESPTRVHAKALLIDEELSEGAVGMIGSHNLTQSGVKLGTEELCIFSRF